MLQVAKEESIELLRETSAPLFVINLCASTTPVALAHPASAELKRYTFFVTRRREEGRERFRLHMGYFDSLEAADAMLAEVRDVYPAAWAGAAPEGRSGPVRAATPAAVASRPVAEAAPVVATPAPEDVPAPAPVIVAPVIAPVIAPVEVPTLTLVETAPVAAVVAAAPAVVAPAAPDFELESMSNVRAVLAELADEPVAANAPTLAPPTLNAVQTLELLEPASRAPVVTSAPVSDDRIEVLTPEDTQTLRDIKLEAQRNAPASYAVQLVWAVRPIDMTDLPHLAIFDAYTLYHVEGNRQGRRWYGLRLGFFTDAEAAKQVAQYVRSEYASVAVVPVTGKEKAGAIEPTPAAATAAAKSSPPPRPDASKIPTVKPLERAVKRDESMAGFKLLADDKPAPAKRDLEDVAGAKAGARPQPPKATGKPAGKRVVVRKQTKPSPPGATQPLESTLEILGASTLTIDESREIINDSAIRKSQPAKSKAGRFSRLLTRLSDRVAR